MSQNHDSDAPPLPYANSLSTAGLGRLGEVLGALRTLGANRLPEGVGAEFERAFGRFRLRGVLGQGTFGIVFLADDPETGRPVALKLPQAAALLDSALADRFRRDVEAVVPLDHPGIVPVLEAGAVAGVTYIVMPFIEGPTLQAWLAGHPRGVPVPTAVELLLALADAVQHAHERGVIHCDLKPANVLLQGSPVSPRPGDADRVSERPGYTPKITDFGLARLLFRPANETQTHLSAGTPPYMAPEQALGVRRDLTARCDVHALAAILYELLTGKPPYAGEDDAECLQQLLDREARPDPPRKLQPGLSRDLEAIVLKGLEKDPSRRYASALALAEDLRRFRAGLPTKARPVGPLGVAVRYVRRRPALTTFLAVSAMVAALLGWMGVHLSQQTFRHRQELELAGHTTELLEFTALLDRMRQRRLERPDGWAESSLDNLRRLAAMRPAADFQEPLRTEAALALAMPRLRLVRELAPGKNAYVAAFTPDGQTLALGERYPVIEGQLRVWLVRLSGEIVRELRYPVDEAWERRPGNKWADGPRSVVFSPDGRWLVLGTRGGRLVRWNLGGRDPEAAGPVAWVMDAGDGKDHVREEVGRLVFSRDGAVLMTGNVGGLLRCWGVRKGWKDVNGGLARLPANTTPTGELVCIQGWFPKVSFSRFDPRTGRSDSCGHDNLSTHTFCFPPDGQRFAAVDGSSRWLIRTDNPDDRRPLFLPEMRPNEEVTDLAFSPDGRWLWFTSEAQASLELWDAVRGALVIRRRVRGGSARLAVSPDGRHLAVCENERTLLFELAPSPVHGAVCEPGELDAFALSADGERLVAVGKGVPAEVPTFPHYRTPVTLHQRTRDGFAWQRHLRVPYAGPFAPRVAISPTDGLGLVVHTLHDGAIGLRSLNGTWTTMGRVDDLRFAPDGRVLWAVAGGGKLIRWSKKDGLEVIYERPPREEEGDPVRGIQVGPRGVLAVRRDGQVVWFDDRDRLRGVWRVFDDQEASSLAWSADGAEVLVGGNLGGVARLKLPSGEVVKRPEAPHHDVVVGLAYLPDGVTLTASADHTVRFWDRDGQPLLVLREAGPIANVAVSPGGRELFVHVRGEWGVRVWNLAELSDQLRGHGIDPGFTVGGTAPVAPAPLPGLVAELYADKTHTYLLERRRDDQVHFNWGEEAPSGWVGADHFSIRWTGWLRPPRPGDWEFSINMNDGAKLWLDGRLILDHPKHVPDPGLVTAVVSLSAKPVSFRLDYYEVTGQAHCKLRWRPAGSKEPFVPVPPEAFTADRATVLGW